MTRYTDPAAVPVPSPVTAAEPTHRPPPQGIPLRDAARLGSAVFSPEQIAADRKVLADAGILDALDEALGNHREAIRHAEEQVQRPALAAFDDGHAHGHRDGLAQAIRAIDRRRSTAEAKGHRILVAVLDEIVDELRAEARP